MVDECQLEVHQFYFGLPNLCDPLRGFGKTPTVDVLAQTLARPAGSATPNLPSAALLCIPAPRLRVFQP